MNLKFYAQTRYDVIWKCFVEPNILIFATTFNKNKARFFTNHQKSHLIHQKQKITRRINPQTEQNVILTEEKRICSNAYRIRLGGQRKLEKSTGSDYVLIDRFPFRSFLLCEAVWHGVAMVDTLEHFLLLLHSFSTCFYVVVLKTFQALLVFDQPKAYLRGFFPYLEAMY